MVSFMPRPALRCSIYVKICSTCCTTLTTDPANFKYLRSRTNSSDGAIYHKTSTAPMAYPNNSHRTELVIGFLWLNSPSGPRTALGGFSITIKDMFRDVNQFVMNVKYVRINLTHCGRVTQICVFNMVKLGTTASSP